VKLREGLRLRWYLDTEGKWTGGYGHLQKKGEEKLVVTQELADKWLNEDISKARAAATKQCASMVFHTEHLREVLVSVNYQLGTSWTLDFYSTWPLIQSGSFSKAAQALLSSKWYRQTPVRVKDFVAALQEAQDLYDQYKATGGDRD
jgi:lysozyme